MLDRAYAVLSIKSLDGDQRIISGLASTPTPDRRGDILEPLGATFRNPLPLLLHHDRERPVGRVTLTATASGIAFEATLPEVTTPGLVRDRVNEAWDSIKAGLITGVSIGFRPLADGIKALKSGGFHLLRTEICELSLVTVPANVDTTIQTIKSFDAPHLAASGRHSLGVTGTTQRSAMTPTTTADHIQNLENKRAATTARMVEIMEAGAADGATLDGTEEAKEHDELSAQVKSIDADLARWREHERLMITKAAPAPGTPTLITTPSGRVHRVSVRPNVPVGTSFIRYSCALALCHGNRH